MIPSYFNDNEIAKWNFNNLFYCYFYGIKPTLFRVAKKDNLHFYARYKKLFKSHDTVCINEIYIFFVCLIVKMWHGVVIEVQKVSFCLIIFK